MTIDEMVEKAAGKNQPQMTTKLAAMAMRIVRFFL
jgi:hypothetical protein